MEDMEEQIKKAVSECEKLRERLSAGESARSALERKQIAHGTKMGKVSGFR